MQEKIYFDTVKTSADGYMVDYSPDYQGNRALLILSFMNNQSKAEMARIMEQELMRWVEKYPIMTQVLACDESDSAVEVKDFDSYGLLWWINPKTKQSYTTWEALETPNYPIADFTDTWGKIFKEISFRTQAQVKEDADKLAKQKRKEYRVFRFIMLIWLFVIPATWIVIQQFGPEWIGWAVSTYAVYKLLLELKKMYFSKSGKPETPEQKEKREMEHHHYHCKLNPDGFAKLRSENFRKEIRKQTRNEYETRKTKN